MRVRKCHARFCESSRAVKPLRAAVIGVGYLGRYHAQKYAALKDVELVAVADADLPRALQVARDCGCRAVDDFHAILHDVDVVSIVVPTERHFEVARDCLEAGLHVLMEKPVTRTVEEAEALIRLADARNRTLQVGHLERFNPALLAVQEVLRDPLYIECYRLAPFKSRGTDVDVVRDLMIHDIDIILNMVKGEIADIRAIGVPVLTDRVDIVQARLEFTSGCVANVTASRVSQSAIRKIRVFQHDAYLSVDLDPPRLVHWRRVRGDGSARLESRTQEFPPADLLMSEVSAFVEAVREGTPPVVSGADGRRALEVASRITAGIGEARPSAGVPL
jgi:predicted dehydrogenase